MREVLPEGFVKVPESAEKVFTGKIFDVYQWAQKLFDGSMETFEMLKRPDTVVIIAKDAGKIAVLRQRQPGQEEEYSLPGGRVNPEDKSEEDAARRELLEETGLAFANFRLLKVEQPYKKIDWLIYTFIAEGFVAEHLLKLDPGEDIELRWLDYDEVAALNAEHIDLDLVRQQLF